MRIVFALLPIAGALGMADSVAAELAGPKIKPPSFPLEPGKKPSVPIDRSNYVSGATEAPLPMTQSSGPISRHRKDPEGGWQSTLKAGWDFANQTYNHTFQAVVASLPVSYGVKREMGSPQSFEFLYRTSPQGAPLSVGIFGSGSFGQAKVTADPTLLPLVSATSRQTEFSLQDFRAGMGARWYLAERRAANRLGVGFDASGIFSNFLTLNSARTQIELDSRRIIELCPRLEYRYEPSDNWGAEVTLGYGLALSGSGSGDTRLDSYHRWVAGAEIFRYLSEANAVGFGLSYEDEKFTWVQSQPTPLTDPLEASIFRLRLFWRYDI